MIRQLFMFFVWLGIMLVTISFKHLFDAFQFVVICSIAMLGAQLTLWEMES